MENRRKAKAMESLENYFENAVSGTLLNGGLSMSVSTTDELTQINSKGIEYNNNISHKKGQVEDISEFEKRE